jgi:hypothetical protein
MLAEIFTLLETIEAPLKYQQNYSKWLRLSNFPYF